MTLTLEQLKAWSDEKILTFMQTTTRDGETLHSAWNETPHPETLFIDFYDEVMSKTYTDEEKERLRQIMLADGRGETVDDDGNALNTLDEMLAYRPRFKEDAAEDCDEINPAYRPVMQLYVFKWLLNNEGWGDEFLLAFVNDELSKW